MAEQQKESLGQRWQNYQPSKTQTFWACVASIVVAIVIGFHWGGWTTAGTAQTMAQQAASKARDKIAATICVQRFVAAPDAKAKLASLKKTSSYLRADQIQAAGWSKMPGTNESNYDVATLCADKLVKLDLNKAGKKVAGAKKTSKTS